MFFVMQFTKYQILLTPNLTKCYITFVSTVQASRAAWWYTKVILFLVPLYLRSQGKTATVAKVTAKFGLNQNILVLNETKQNEILLKPKVKHPEIFW